MLMGIVPGSENTERHTCLWEPGTQGLTVPAGKSSEAGWGKNANRDVWLVPWSLTASFPWRYIPTENIEQELLFWWDESMGPTTLGVITVTGFLSSSFRLWEVQNSNCWEPVPSKYCETTAIPANLSNAATLGGLLSLLWHERVRMRKLHKVYSPVVCSFQNNGWLIWGSMNYVKLAPLISLLFSVLG